MGTAVNKAAAWSAACALLATLPVLAAAQDSRAAGEGRWVPSLALTGGATFQKMDSAVESACAVGGPGDPNAGFAPCIFPPEPYPPPIPPIPTPSYKVYPDSYPPAPTGDDYTHPPGPATLRPTTTGVAEWAISPFVGADLQLMTPAIGPIPGRPRFFVRGEIQFLFPPERDIAMEKEPSAVSLPSGITTPNGTSATAMAGQGSKTASEVQLLSFGVGAGIAFPFQVRGRRVWVKPSVGWTRFGVDVEGLVVSAIKDDRLPDPGDPRPLNPPYPYPVRSDADIFGANLREVSLSGDESRIFNGIGPGLEVEMDAGHYGPIGVSLFAGGSAYRVFGDRSISFGDEREFPDPVRPVWRGPYWQTHPEPLTLPADTYSANWSHEIDPWLFRAVVGVRLSWLGK